MNGTTEAVRELLRNNPDITAAEAIAALPDHHPGTVRTQTSRQREAIRAELTATPKTELSLMRVCAVELDDNARIAGGDAVPDELYFMIVLQSAKDREARVTYGQGGKARQKFASLRTSNSVTDADDRNWIEKQGGCTATILLPA